MPQPDGPKGSCVRSMLDLIFTRRGVHPLAIQVMRECGIDISANRPKSIEQFLVKPFDYVVTVCDGAKESCPVFTGTVTHRLHIGFDDPAAAIGSDEELLAVFRRVGDEIEARFGAFYHETLRM